jgi:hypothetical protein
MRINKFESRFKKIKRFQKFHPSDFDFSDRTLESNLKKKIIPDENLLLLGYSQSFLR